MAPERVVMGSGSAPPAIALQALTRIGTGLQRPECVLATAAGDLYTADWRGGVAHMRADGTQALYRCSLPGNRPARPNGIALRRETWDRSPWRSRMIFSD